MIYARLEPSSKTKDISKCIDQLRLAKICTPIYHTDSNGVPLRSEYNPKKFKTIILDIGLYLTMLGINPIEIDSCEDVTLINQGALMEQFIGQQLLCLTAHYKEPELYYWERENKSSSAEIDYVVSNSSKVVPIEVKSGKTGRLKSLQVFCSEKKTPLAVRFNGDTPSLYKESRTILGDVLNYTLMSLPHYLAPQLQRLIEAATLER